MTTDLDAALKPYVDAVLGRKAVNPVILDIQGLTSIADAFIICSGRSNRQVSAIAEHVERELRERKIRPLSVEGSPDGQWVLMDYGHVLIHVFYEPVREFYDLEGLWSDAPRVPIPAAARPKKTRRVRPPGPAE
jgi:ribosome-associated protein